MKIFLYIAILLSGLSSFATVDCPSNYPSGGTLTYSSGAMNYPSGGSLRYSNGSLNDSSGASNTTGSVSLSTKFGNNQMRIVVRAHSANFQASIPYGNGIMLVDFDEQGNVTCTLEVGSSSSEFRVDGNRGSAYVTVKPGQNINSVKDAVQKALDGF